MIHPDQWILLVPSHILCLFGVHRSERGYAADVSQKSLPSVKRFILNGHLNYSIG